MKRPTMYVDGEDTRERSYTVCFWLLLFLFEAFIASLPLFPNGDGGLHIYYASIFHDLLQHSSALYAKYYAIRHLVQPYLLHYYVFIALRFFVSADAAEKILVALVTATFALGFRALVRSLSPHAPALTLMAFPFLFNWPLAMGGLNYDFAIGLLCFALASYEGLTTAGPVGRRLWQFAGLLALLVLSHPIPLLLLICIVAVDLMLRWWQGRGTSRTSQTVAAERPRALAFGLACLAFLIPALIADKGEVGKSLNDVRLHTLYFRQIYNASHLTMFILPGFGGRLYNKCFTLLYPASLALVVASGFIRRMKQRALSTSDRLAFFSALFLVASLFAPGEMNGSGFFAMRLWFPCWMLGIASCAGAVQGTKWNRGVAAYAVVLALSTLGMAQAFLRPIARKQLALEHAPLPFGEKGLFIQGIAAEKGVARGLTYPVYWWNGGRAFIAHRDVMLNSAWLYLTIIPLKENGKAGLVRDYTQRVATENPNEIDFYFTQHPAERKMALHDADFILFTDLDPQHSDPGPVIRMTLEPYLADWHCGVATYYAICKKRGALTASMER